MPTLLFALLFALSGQSVEIKIDGAVVEQTGVPVAGATVVVLGEHSGRPTALTDEAGKFALTVRPTERNWRSFSLLAHKDGVVLGGGAFKNLGVQQPPLHIVVAKPTIQTIRVVDPEDRPVSEAKVSLHLVRVGDTFLSEDPQLPGIPSLVTDADGACEFKLSSAIDRLGIDVESPRFGRQRYYSERMESLLPLTLRSVGGIKGRIVADDADATRNIEIYARSSKRVEEKFFQGTGESIVRTDESGGFEIATIAEGSVTLSIRLDLARPFRLQSEVKAMVAAGRATEVEVRLVRGVPVRGTVVAAETKKPIAGVRLSVQDRLHEAIDVVTNSAGEYFALIGPQGGSIAINDNPEGFLPLQIRGRSAKPTAGMAGIQVEPFELRMATTLRGSVVDADGEPVANAWVIAGWNQMEGDYLTNAGRSTRSDAKGMFEFSPVPVDIEVRLRAETRTLASEQYQIVKANDDRPLQLVMTRAGMAPFSGRVVDEAGMPLPGVRITVTGAPRTVVGGDGANDPVLDNEWRLVSAADGHFEIPSGVPKLVTHWLVVESPGWLERRFSVKFNEKGESAELSKIALFRVRSIKGVVIDSQGKLVAGASVRIHNVAGGMAETTTGATGRFEFHGAHPYAAFAFCHASGYRFGGAALHDESTPIVLRREDEIVPARDRLRTVLRPRAERARHMAQLLAPVHQWYLDRPNVYPRHEVLAFLAPFDPQFVQVELPRHSNRWGARTAVLRALGDFDEAKASVGEIADPYSRALSVIELADAVPNAALKSEFLANARIHAGAVADPERKALAISDIAARLFEVGKVEECRRLINEFLPAAEKLSTRKTGARGRFAATVALVDMEKALELTNDFEDKSEAAHYRRVIASAIAGSNPAAAERILLEAPPAEFDWQAQGACYRMARADLDRAIRLADRFDADRRLETRAYAYGFMAHAIAASDPMQARELLQKAFAILEKQGRSQRHGNPTFGVAWSLVHIAESADPRRIDEYSWRALALHTGPTSVEDVDHAAQNADLASFLALFDMEPVVRGRLMETVFRYLESGKELPVHSTESVAIYVAMILNDPERAIRWHDRDFPKRTIQSLDYRPWAIMAEMLADDQELVWRSIMKRVNHLRPFDVED